MDADVDVDTKATSIRRYADLDDGAQDTFQSLLRDGDLRDSWLQVAGQSEVPLDDIRHALNNVDEIREYGTVDRFYTGRQVQQQEYPSGWDDVYPEDSVVTEYSLTQQTRFYRLYTEGETNQAGRFLLRSDEDIRTMSRSELQGKFAIPGSPPDTVAQADIPAGTTMRTGKVAANDFGAGGGRQFTLPKSQLPDLPEDWFEKAPELTQELNN